MKKRRKHTWSPNKRNSRPKHVMFVDVESWSIPQGDSFEKHTLRLGWACYQKRENGKPVKDPEWLYFDDTQRFWGFVREHLNARINLHIVGHGLGYDLGILGLSQIAESKNWEKTFYYNKGPNCMISYSTHYGKVRFLSTTNLFTTSLRKLGHLVGLEKGEVDFKNVDDDTLSGYCKRDVEIVMKLWEVWLDFLDTHDLGDFKGTIASQAFAAYRHRFMPTPVWIHGDMDVCKLERQSYRGGRTEVFRQGEFPEGDYYKLDVNGLYGYIMETGIFPCDFIRLFETITPSVLGKMIDRYSLVARVKLYTDLPVFPVKMNGVNAFPVGTFETVLTTPELDFALKHCKILDVKEVATYKSYPLFRDYAAYFSGLKAKYGKERNDTFRMISKLFNNALYGKLAQRDYNADRKDKVDSKERVTKPNILSKNLLTILIEIIRELWDKWGQVVWGNDETEVLPIGSKLVREEKWTWKELLGKKPKTHVVRNLGTLHVQTGLYELPDREPGDIRGLKEVEESYNSFPAISAHVTAYARLYLWELMVKAGRENVYYCDTDGFICNRQGYKNCIDVLDPHKPGYLKIEGQADHLTILRRKGYIFDDKRTICGIRENAKELEPLVFEQDQFLGVPGAIKLGDPDLRGVKRVVKRVNTDIKGGIVGPDGWVTPFRVNGKLEILNPEYGEEKARNDQ